MDVALHLESPWILMFVYSSELFEHSSTLSSVVSGPLAVGAPVDRLFPGVQLFPSIIVALCEPSGEAREGSLQVGDGPLVRLLVSFTDK